MAAHFATHLEPQRKRVLIAVKAYPLPSRSYTELVCTAGVLEDGSWIRIYPVPFRFLSDEKRYKKYQWIDIDLIRHTSDHRPESYRPVHPDLSDAEIVDFLDTRDKWRERRKFCCQDVYTSITKLINDSKKPQWKSLATFKPTRILDLLVDPVEREWKDEWLELRKQGDLFASTQDKHAAPIRKLPYKFRYRMVDEEGKESKLMIEDWEIGALYWNCLKQAEGDESVAIEKVRQKYLDTFRKKDLHLFLGTTQRYHGKARNPFVIIGVLYPPPDPAYSDTSRPVIPIDPVHRFRRISSSDSD